MVEKFTLRLKPHEQMFDVKPTGIRYICDSCNEGEMISNNNTINLEKIVNHRPMYEHKCNKCGMTMLLPKSYPYIEWIPVGQPVEILYEGYELKGEDK